ncbi:MAG: type II/IV secretion system protein [Candidatus Scalindua sp. AMX11]|nr:MAG: type II/IV secretion system protein [Candidatus Scalindua sp.]NOG84608.1 type II/IV secretion system protein [Planctomycetota bacterium]RZV92382.1 MAG: type II/IV secretion system protein [Candidatus Scalindua sp. SCAELEC01]TDE66093.1 MAG: type II/IV secretion system protein [Candidatus Scalindua sp. AMX11]GJQ59067.1 MAG: type IV fimbrial assembly protein PilB [Candidatus Scalindua sp.]
MSSTKAQRKLFGKILVEKGVVNQDQLREALEIQKINGKGLGNVLVDLDYTTDELISEALGDYLNMEVVSLEDSDLKLDVLQKISPALAKLYRVIPIAYDDSSLTIAQEYALNLEQIDVLRFLLQKEIKPVIAPKDEVADALEKYYPGNFESVEELLGDFKDDISQGKSKDNRETIDIEQLKELANDAPVKTFVNMILLQAVIDHASDIHLETFENSFRVRYRIDGQLVEKIPVPPSFTNGILSRIKVLAEMDIAERRLPQDGRIMINIRGHSVDIRVSTLPTKFGESIVMRVLDKQATSLDLTQLGIMPNDISVIQKLMKNPNGIVLITGPTGSGKTTTLYSALNHVNEPGIKIITTEDPVEYDVEGIMQIQINNETGVTFASSLRAILRQDPDIILIGEIRDLETLEIAIQASLTGHLVFSTLHTNDAPSTITRLIDMDVKPYLITASLLAVISQRLVRKICTECREEYQPELRFLEDLSISELELKDKQFFKGTGCQNCNGTGYKGRMSILEIMIIDEEIRSYIIQQSSTEVLREKARESGMNTLREAGLKAAYSGLTTVEEVIRETCCV